MSYEVISGLGSLGASGSGCSNPSKEIPATLSQVQRNLAASKSGNCPLDTSKFDPVVAGLCNASALPLYCYNAKFNGVNLLGRGSASDVQAWQNWVPGSGINFATGKPVSDEGGSAGSASGAEGMSDGMFYGLVGLGVLLIGGGAIYFATR